MSRIKSSVTAIVLLLAMLLTTFAANAADGTADQSTGNEAASGMYRYDIDIYLYNPCNSNDMDNDAVYQLWFDFGYKANNGYGNSSTYRFDLSWNKNKKQNLNADVLKAAFVRPNDNEYMTHFSVWVPGIVDSVKVHLNMDGGERLAFTVENILLNGYRINTDTDYVSSAYYDSDAVITCHTPQAALLCKGGTVDRSKPAYDQYGGVFSGQNTDTAIENARYGDGRMLYHYGFD